VILNLHPSDLVFECDLDGLESVAESLGAHKLSPLVQNDLEMAVEDLFNVHLFEVGREVLHGHRLGSDLVLRRAIPMSNELNSRITMVYRFKGVNLTCKTGGELSD
jgi:diphthamide synthase (EF-2-diphthine--ammonia ligase)